MSRSKNPYCVCDNCGNRCRLSELVPLAEVDRLGERIEPGEEVPAGECRKCGALAHLIGSVV